MFNDQNKKIFEILNFGHCDLFDIWDLLFGIYYVSFKLQKNENLKGRLRREGHRL
jgi:hypothetical protein